MRDLFDLLNKHGWPPANIIVIAILIVGIYFLYNDNKDMHGKWELLAKKNLEANITAIEQRKVTSELLATNLTTQKEQIAIIRDWEIMRTKQRELDNRLTAMAVQTLQQLADKVDVQTQLKSAEQVLKEKGE